jgi:hypothetical protein
MGATTIGAAAVVMPGHKRGRCGGFIAEQGGGARPGLCWFSSRLP